jgi:hypothetical protein
MPCGIRRCARHRWTFQGLRGYSVAVGWIGFFDLDGEVNPPGKGHLWAPEILRPAHAFLFSRFSPARNRVIRSTRSYGTGLSSGNWMVPLLSL